jgi:two-component system phosphate regulon sensor histidine kinase PhoR
VRVRLAVHTRLLLLSIGLILIALLVGDAVLSRSLDRNMTAHIRADLRTRLALVERYVMDAERPLDDLDAWDRLADELGRRASGRVTIMTLDGVVVGDSDVPREALASVENHAGRPEVLQAIHRGEGTDTRKSATVGRRMMYVAIPFRWGDDTAGVVRLAEPLSEVDAAIAEQRRLLVIASVIALVAASLVSVVAHRRVARSVGSLTRAARRMAAGELEARTRVTGADEVGELGRTLDRLAASLSETLGELRAQRDRMGGILDAMQEGVLLLDASGRIALVNPALREMLLLPSDTIGKLPLEVIRHAEMSALLEKATGATTPVTGEIEVAGVKPRRLLVRAHALAGEGEPGGVLCVVIDVTDLRRLETLRRDFVANVSHELRTPVTTVRSAAETLLGGAAADPAASRRFIDIINRNAERLQQLVEDLLDLSKIESRQYQLKLEPVELAAALGQIASLSRERADARRISIRVDAPDGLAVRVDRRAFEQVVNNLVDNAVKYCGEGCHVVVSAAAQDGDVKILVADDGPGIEARHLPRLFERFYRVDAGRSRDQGGTGLGLSIVKHLVEAMGGRVSVESSPGRGTTFCLTLPRATT